MTPEASLARQPEDRAEVPASDCQSLRECLSARLQSYFRDLDDHPSGQLHALVMAEVEAPLLAIVLRHADGNLSRAAAILGMHRATLRRKLDHYGLA